MMEKMFLKATDDPTFEKLPKNLPNTIKIEIYGLNRQVEKKNSMVEPFFVHSFADLPKTLPRLNTFSIFNSNITNFKGLTSEMPNLYLFYIYNSTIDSFEGLKLSVPKNNKELRLYLENCTVRSLGGVSRSTIQAIAIAILSMDYGEPSYSKFSKKIKLDLSSAGQKLLYDSIDPAIYQTYNPKHSHGCSTNINLYFDHSAYFDNSDEWHGKDEWIYGSDLTERLFISEKLDKLYEFYRKTTIQLAQEYITNLTSLSTTQIERLIHEADYKIMKLLENNLPLKNSVLNKIMEKISFKTQKGLILK